MVFLGQAGGKHHLLVATIMQVPLFMAILVIEIISPLHLLLFPIILVFLFYQIFQMSMESRMLPFREGSHWNVAKGH